MAWFAFLQKLFFFLLPSSGCRAHASTVCGGFPKTWLLPPTPVVQVLWTLSIYLEAVAILPQLFLVSKTGEAETITSHYLFCLGSYRALYLLNWVYRYYTEQFYDLIAIVAGLVQTILYCDFFYLYVTRGERAPRRSARVFAGPSPLTAFPFSPATFPSFLSSIPFSPQQRPQIFPVFSRSWLCPAT